MIIKSALDSCSRSGVCRAVLFTASDLPSLLEGPIHLFSLNSVSEVIGSEELGDICKMMSLLLSL